MSERGARAIEPAGYGLLDLLRWGSACLVAVGHVRNLLFLDYADVPHANPLIAGFYALTGLGHEAVIVFFVISGFLVGGGLLVRGATAESLLDYFIHRFSRIYVVLIPALIVTVTLDLTGVLAQPSLYTKPGWASALDFSAAERASGIVFVCNLVNLQDAFCPSYGSNAPLWSLAYEWFYYLTFPFLLTLGASLQEKRISAGSIGVGALVLLLFAWLFPNFLSYYPIWLMGVAARAIVQRGLLSMRWAQMGLVLLPIMVGFARPHTYPAVLTDFLIGLALALLLSNIRMLRGPSFLSRFSSAFAGFSYSLYVVHFPLLVFGVAILTKSGVMAGRLAPSVTAFALFSACLLIAYSFAWVFSLVTEQQTPKLRRLLSQIPTVREGLGIAVRVAFRAPLPRGVGNQPRLKEREHP